MPQLPAATNCVIAVLSGNIGNGTWSNVFHMQYTGTAPQVADLTTIGGGLVTAWTTNIAPLVPTTTSLTGWVLADLTNQTAAQTRASITAVPGTRTGTANPNNCALVSSWQVNLRYRGGHPRTYWPAGVQADVTSGSQWSATFRTAALSGIGAFRTAVNALTHGTTTYKLIMLSYYSNKVLRPQPLALLVNGVAIHGRVDTQRHRLGKETP